MKPSDRRMGEALQQALDLGEIGVQVAAYLGGELIVEDSIGVAHPETGIAVTNETLFPAFSVGKAVAYTTVHLQVERGKLELDRPVAQYWPEFGQEEKEHITIRDVLTHRAGLPQVPVDLEVAHLSDWSYLIDFLARQKPLCAPGFRSMYHTITSGFILGEVVRRTDPKCRPFMDFVREEINLPLGIEDMWFGLPPEHDRRVAKLSTGLPGQDSPSASDLAPPLSPIRAKSVGKVRFDPDTFNRDETWRVCFPSAGVVMNARSGARFFSLLATGGLAGTERLLSRETLLAFTRPRPNPMQIDEAIGHAMWIGTGGYMVGGDSPPAHPCLGGAPHALTQSGAGGAIGWADLDIGLAVMINHNRMFGELPASKHPFVPIARAVRDIAGVGQAKTAFPSM